jgi:hypothetical protein
VSPIPNVRLPGQSIFECVTVPSSSRRMYAQIVPSSPTGTLTKKTRRQLIAARTPPTTSPTNWPARKEMPLMPKARPRCSGGKASVRMACEFANRNAPPTPCTRRMKMIQIAPAGPVNGVRARSSDPTVKMTKPALYMRTRPNMSPRRPNATTSTAVTSR